jgi:hypothetical protein
MARSASPSKVPQATEQASPQRPPIPHVPPTKKTSRSYRQKSALLSPEERALIARRTRSYRQKNALFCAPHPVLNKSTSYVSAKDVRTKRPRRPIFSPKSPAHLPKDVLSSSPRRPIIFPKEASTSPPFRRNNP